LTPFFFSFLFFSFLFFSFLFFCWNFNDLTESYNNKLHYGTNIAIVKSNQK